MINLFKLNEKSRITLMRSVAINTKNKIYRWFVDNQFENFTIPNLITYFTLVFSLSGIYLLLSGHFLMGALLLWTVCDIFDTLDGFIARKFNMFSPLGADLDSLIDVISFLMPPFLISLQSGNDFLMISAFFFVFSGIYRLARYNVVKSSKGVVVGLQASLAAHLIYLSLLIDISSNSLSIVYIILSFLMISPKKSKGKHSLYLTALLITLNLLLIVLNIYANGGVKVQ